MSENKVIFISYSSKNMEIAEKARDYLEENGLNCWMAPRDIKTSVSYAQAIMDGLINANMVLLVFSKDSHDSKYVREELNNAFIRDKPILPFKIDDTLPSGRVEFFLRNQQWLDASSDPESFFDQLLEDANRILKGIPFAPVEILLSEKMGANLDSPEKIEGLYQNMGNASRVIMNFEGIEDMSDEFALEYLSQKKKKNYGVIEINRSEKIKRILKNVSSPQEPKKRNILPLVAVAAVILNRVASPDFPNTISGVIYQPWAFTAVNDGQISLEPDQTAYNAARDALNGWDPTYGCLYYYNPTTATSQWIYSRQTVVQIGEHIFAI